MSRSRHRPAGGPARLLAALAALFLGLAASGCGSGGSGPRWNVLLVTLDTTRADVLGCYGRETSITPHLDRLAAESVLYGRAYTVSPLTLPSHASMLTGLYPLRHTVRDNGLWPLPEAAETLAESARAAGFQTAAFLASVVLDDNFGLDQGFEKYGLPSRLVQGEFVYAARPAAEVVDAALGWLDGRDPARPFFLWAHVYDPHAPYEPPEGFEGHGSPYEGEVAYVDREIGRLLDELRAEGTLDTTVVCVVADHGEAFGEHREYTHGSYCYESTLRVPLLLRYPDGHRAAQRSREIVSVVDVHPTLAEAMGLPVPPGIDGVSLWRREVPADRGVYFETYHGWLSMNWSQLAGWLDRNGKYLHSSEPQFFDLSLDPGELENLVEKGADVEPYRRAIAAVADRPALEAAPAGAADEALLAELRALGYASLGVAPPELPHPLEPSDRPSPAKMALQYYLMIQAVDLAWAGRPEEAIPRMRRALEQYPRNWFLTERLAYCLLREERWREALPLYERLTREAPPRAVNFQNLGWCLALSGRDEEAIEAYRGAIALDPENEGALEGLAQSLSRVGREAEARVFRERLAKLR